MGICAVVEGKIFCVHSGLSENVNTLDQINFIERGFDIPEEGSPFYDLVHNNPELIENWALERYN